jgi:putative copper export protein
MPTNAIHQVAVAVWAGGLVYLVLVCGAPRTESSGLTCASAVQRVSGAAVVAIIAVAVSGALQTWLFLPDLAALTGTRYGQLALAKTAGLLVLAGFGAYHRFRLMPALADAGDEAGLTRSVRREIWVMGIVVFIAAFLAHASPEAG